MISFSRFIQAMTLCSLVLATVSGKAGDKVGNGGGVWVCEGPQLEIFDILFMDVYEARREYKLNLPESDLSDLEIVRIQKPWIEKFLLEPRQFLKHIEYVEKNVTWIDDVIIQIPDGANKTSPHPTLCKQGEWKAVQLVNFTDDFRILVRRELFESSFMSNLERAAVYLHEGIYSYLRSEAGDSTSVRARAIVGFLLSDLPNQEKVERIQKTLQQSGPPEDPPPPSQGWICGIKPQKFSALYIGENSAQQKAKESALKACQDGENHMPPGFPFPGEPLGDCKAEKILCEAILSAEKSKSCKLDLSPFGKIYEGVGRTRLEAQKEAMNQCLAVEGIESKCYDGDDLTCN
ncbi:MAG: hypothetical protein ACAH59_06825 [Pseudobdellovibrionaceae bacterium]